MSDRLASERQLWRLNKEGYVSIREEQGEPLTSADVHPLVSSIMEAYQLGFAARIRGSKASPSRGNAR